MNFNQWKGYAAKSDVAKVTYICGSEDILVELVIKDIMNILNPPITDFIKISAKETSDVWELASQYPLDPDANRLVIIRDAETITDWEGLYGWVANSRNNPKNHIVFVAAINDATSTFDKGKRTGYVEHIDYIRNKGKFIKCSTPSDDDIITWAQSYGLSKASAQYLIERTSANISSMLNVLRKVRIWNGSPSPKALELLCDQQFTQSFSQYLIERNKVAALEVAKNMSEDSKIRALTELDYNLTYLFEIGICTRKRMYDSDIATSTGIKIFIVKKLRPVVKDYDERKIKYCRQLLAMTDSALRDGAKAGVMEGLISLW